MLLLLSCGKAFLGTGNGHFTSFYQTRISLLTNFVVIVQSVRHLDVAIDMHISLVQMRNVRAGLAEGKELRARMTCDLDTAKIG